MRVKISELLTSNLFFPSFFFFSSIFSLFSLPYIFPQIFHEPNIELDYGSQELFTISFKRYFTLKNPSSDISHLRISK